MQACDVAGGLSCGSGPLLVSLLAGDKLLGEPSPALTRPRLNRAGDGGQTQINGCRPCSGLLIQLGELLFGARETHFETLRAQGLRYGLSQLDALHHSRFEDAVRDLLRRDGCPDAVRVGGGGDLGADVKATDPYGRRWVIQCKHRRDGLGGPPVGTPDLQVLNGTARQVRGADVAVIVTNGRVTTPAVTFAEQQRLHVVDRHTLGVWASGLRPLWKLLRAVPPPREPTAHS